MSRSKQNILNTEAMLTRLTNLLVEHRDLGIDTKMGLPSLTARSDAEDLRRISMTLHRWHEAECNGEIERSERAAAQGKPMRVWNAWSGERHSYDIPDREAGAHKRLAKILARYPSLTAYVQGDPRGCALYILKPGDVPEDATVNSCYSRGLAVFR